jgi:membrane-associated PAP2 superfamily phosphatase
MRRRLYATHRSATVSSRHTRLTANAPPEPYLPESFLSSFHDHYRSEAGRRFLRAQSVWLVVALAVLAVFNVTDLDRALTRQFFDSAQQSFPWTDNWWLKKALHDYARTASAICAVTVLGLTTVAWFGPRGLSWLRARRHELAFVALASLGSSLLVGVLKHFSAHACPWALTEFGGTNVYAHLFGAVQSAPGMQGCFPAAHPLSGYAWLCVAFVLYPRFGAKVAWSWWATAFALGTVFGIVQIMRGAHFLSHVLWTAWLVWAADVALVALYSYATSNARAGEPAAAPADAPERPERTLLV